MSREAVVTEAYLQHMDAEECDSRCPWCRLKVVELALEYASPDGEALEFAEANPDAVLS